MSGSSATPTPPLSLAEMQVLVSRAGLTLNPGQMADLVLAWRQVVALVASIPRDRPLLDDQAFVFRLPPPPVRLASRAWCFHERPPSRPPASRPPASRPPASRPPANHPPANHPPANHPIESQAGRCQTGCCQAGAQAKRRKACETHGRQSEGGKIRGRSGGKPGCQARNQKGRRPTIYRQIARRQQARRQTSRAHPQPSHPHQGPEPLHGRALGPTQGSAMSAIPPSLTIAEAGRLIAAKKLSPVELTKTMLARIKAVDPKINAFLAVTEKQALAAARAAERAVMAGQKHPLLGIPVAYKDIYETAGVPTTAHSRILQTNVPRQDAETVRRLREAGTIMLGKLATHEFAIGGPAFDLPWPPSRNPSGHQALHRRLQLGVRRGGGGRTWRSARSAPTPAARSDCPRRSAASPA